MPLSLRQVRNRVRSVENIKKITRAMEMVSVAKLKPLERRLFTYKEYFSRTEGILNNLLASFKEFNHPFLQEKQDKHNILLCLITSDTGLCGTYNNAVIRAAWDFIHKHNSSKVSLVTLGKKGFIHFKKTNLLVTSAYTQAYGKYSDELTDRVAKELAGAFLSGRADEVYIVYTNFISAARAKPLISKLLNIEKGNGRQTEYLVEPDINNLLREFIPLYINAKVKNAVMNAFTAEHSARVVAMSEANTNAKELLEDLILLRNKVRQAHITRELIEVISSAEALRG